MDFQDCLMPALERVISFDMPDEAYGAAIAGEAHLMAGASLDLDDLVWDH